MIRFGDKILITNPHQLYDRQKLAYAQKKHETDSLTFVVPDYLKKLDVNGFREHQIHTMYKVGFLTEVVRHLFPDYSSKDVFSLLYIEFQIFMTERTMRQNLTYWNRYREQLLIN